MYALLHRRVLYIPYLIPKLTAVYSIIARVFTIIYILSRHYGQTSCMLTFKIVSFTNETIV